MMDADFLVEKLGCSLIEANDILAHDKKVDRGLDPYPLKKEQQQAVRKAISANRGRPKTKSNENKQKLMQIIFNAIEPECEQLSLVNSERELLFVYKDVKYKIILSCPRK